jgi:sirohydrochlorin ferrochelatase
VTQRSQPPEHRGPGSGEAAVGRSAALLAIAHGSRDPRHAAALHRLLDAVRQACPDLLTELGFLDLCGPDVTTALARLAESGADDVAVVPLFLNRGYHVGHDIPAVTERARRALRKAPSLRVAGPLGPDPLLTDAVEQRLRESGVQTADPRLRLAEVSATSAPAADMIRELREQGATQIAVAAYFLAPGLLYDRAIAQAQAAHVPIAAPLTTPDDEPPAELVRLVLARYAQAVVREPTLAAV